MFFWFATGLVIMYATPTTQSRSQQLAHAEILLPDLGWLSLGEAWERSAEQRKAAADKPKAAKNKPGDTAVRIADARLVRSAGEPLWLVEDSHGLRFALSALDGSLHKTTPELAVKIAENWFQASDSSDFVRADYIETVDNPVILRNQEALSPFHRIAVGDGGELLISARTGEVLHASTRVDRAFYWAGNWLHLFKPLESIGWGSIRHDVQLWLGFLATVATLLGLVIGWLRWRPGFRGKPTYSQGRTQPYREFWFKWHFWSGLIGGSVALTWAFSGFIDTNPGKIFSQANPNKQEITRYLGNGVPEVMRRWRPVLPLEQAVAIDEVAVVELAWRHLDKDAVLLAYRRDGQRLPQTADGASLQFNDDALLAAVQRVAGQAEVESSTLLTEYDSYYYPRHHQGLTEKPLPVQALQLADPAATRFYLDPQDGKLIAKPNSSARTFRWLYSALHHWDFGWLYYRPLWDVWMLNWLAFGLVLGGSSLVMGWRLLKKTFAAKRRPQPAPRQVPSVGKVVEISTARKIDAIEFTHSAKEPIMESQHRI